MNLLFCFILMFVAKGTISVSPSPCITSSVGNNFVFGIIGFYSVITGPNIHLHITPVDQIQANVRITAPFINMDRTLRIYNYTITTLNSTQIHFENGTKFKGIEVSSDVKISVHVVTFSSDYEEGFLVLPVNALGTRYIASSYKPYSIYSSEIIVVGVESDTDVLLLTKIGGYSRSNISIRLQKFESYQFKTNDDISGSIITSNKPIAVISGSAFAEIPIGIGHFQYIIEQMVPTKYWTTTFIVSPVYPRKYFVLRFFADYDNTEIQYYNNTKHYSVFMAKGSMEEVLFGTDPVVVIANKPISVIQYGHDGDNMAGDPFMSTVQGISQYIDSYKLTTQSTYSRSDTVAITIQKNNVSGLLLNGLSMSHYNVKNMTVPPPMNQYITMFLNISYNSYYHLYHTEGLKFGAVIYGRPDIAAAYGYPLRLSLIETDCNVPNHVTSTVLPDFSTQTIQTKNGTWCFQCKDMSHLKYCNKVSRCQYETEVCFVQRYPVSFNVYQYRSGCTLPEKCSHVNDCIECCQGDFCNKAGCGDLGLPELGQRGPLCFDCTNTDEKEDCNTVKLCHSNQDCIITKYEWGDDAFYHKMECADTQVCRTQRSLSHLTTRNIPVCSQCCSTDFCNMNCTSVDTFPSIVG